ncbi:DUF1254 domain-containing protein [Mycobacteroides salmoniphilum]|uniref:DUF1254 domain-containing protein n=1 Tax=Mycobacteroides salmoniphilum TaxID=404941 RepID=UPI001AD7FCCA|nr:DUF1254 domain-containing protein [Mycobacteroides salmoniphilum]
MNVGNFVRAETDRYFQGFVNDGGFGRLVHRRELTPIDAQDVVRMNRDTLYSSGVFDLQVGPVTVTLPDSGGRFVSLLSVSEDHYAVDVVYSPGKYTLTRDRAGTRYAALLIRTFVNPTDPVDIAAAHRVQDGITVEQDGAPGSFQVPDWDPATLAAARSALESLGALGDIEGLMFGARTEVDPIAHLIGTAIGWGGNPPYAAMYETYWPTRNDGNTPYSLTVKDVPVDGFWSVSVYDATGFFQKNDTNAYTLNSLTAQRNPDGSHTIEFGDCGTTTINCLPITPGWNYVVRLYRSKPEALDNTWRFPSATPR